MRDEGAAAVAFINLGWPGWLVVFWIGADFPIRCEKLHRRTGGEIGEPHVRCINIGGGRVPATVVARGFVGEVSHTFVVEPDAAKTLRRDGTNQNRSILDV